MVLTIMLNNGITVINFSQGKGFPDINTRLMLRRIWEELQLPIFALMDADPHGIEIMCVYRFGSLVRL